MPENPWVSVDDRFPPNSNREIECWDVYGGCSNPVINVVPSSIARQHIFYDMELGIPIVTRYWRRKKKEG